MNKRVIQSYCKEYTVKPLITRMQGQHSLAVSTSISWLVGMVYGHNQIKSLILQFFSLGVSFSLILLDWANVISRSLYQINLVAAKFTVDSAIFIELVWELFGSMLCRYSYYSSHKQLQIIYINTRQKHSNGWQDLGTYQSEKTCEHTM